jgi:glycosyltransferase involved in cell wall biosynthesis
MCVTENESISAIIPFFNAADTLPRAIQSILNQTSPVREIIVVDDASTTEQKLALEEMADAIPQLRYIRLDQNGGPSIARNRGVEVSQGKYVAFLDADDQWVPEKLECTLRVMREMDIDFLGHNNIIGGKKRLIINDRLRPGRAVYAMRPLDIFVSTSQFAPSTVVFRKGGIPVHFDESIRRSEDYRLWAELIFGGYKLWKAKSFLAIRDEGHVKGRGLSGDLAKLLDAHLNSVRYFRERGFISERSMRMLTFFIRTKYLRHR